MCDQVPNRGGGRPRRRRLTRFERKGLTWAMAARTEPPLGERTALLILALAVFAVVTTEMLPIGLLPAISSTFAESESTTGLLVSLYAAVVALLAVPLTLATRPVARKRLLLIAIGCFTVSNVIVAVAPTFAILAAGRVIGGATHALFFSVAIGYATRLVPRALTGRALALASAGASAGFVLGLPLATALGNAVGWRGAFVALAVLMTAVFAAVALKLPAVSSDPGDDRPVPGRRPQLLAAITSNMLTYLGHYTLYTYITVLLLRSHATRSSIGPILLLFGGAGLVSLALAGPGLDRHFRRTALLALALVLIGIGASGAGYPTLAVVMGAGVIWNGAFAPVASIFQTAAVHARAASPDMAGAFINATSNIGIGGGAALGGLVFHHGGIRADAWTGAVSVALAIAIVLPARRTFADRFDHGRPPSNSA